jgi:hypothetical protein
MKTGPVRLGSVAVAMVVATGVAALAPKRAEASVCAMSDVTMQIGSTSYPITACADAVAQGAGPSVETNNLNTAFGTNYTFLSKDDPASPGSDITNTAINGIDIWVSSTTNGTAGSWTLNWADTNGSSPVNLPVELSLIVGLFGGNNGAGYLIPNVILPDGPYSAQGSFAITFTNAGNATPIISHLDLLGGTVVQATQTTMNDGTVPEPASLSLLGMGLIGVAGTRLRQRR